MLLVTGSSDATAGGPAAGVDENQAFPTGSMDSVLGLLTTNGSTYQESELVLGSKMQMLLVAMLVK